MAAYSIFVSPTGNDSNNGSSAATPYEHLSVALADAATKSPSTNQVTIWLMGGTYRRTAATFLNSTHSGSNGNPLVIRAYNQQTPVFSGNYSIPASFVNLVTNSDPRWNQIPLSVRGKMLVIDLTAAGVPATAITRRGFSISQNTPSDMFPSFNGVRLSKARWPKAGEDYSSTLDPYISARRGYVGYSSIASAGTSASGTVGGTGGSVVVPSQVAVRLSSYVLDNAWVKGYLAEAWEWTYNKISSFASSTLGFAYAEQSNIHNGSFKNAFFLENILEECYLPGEYYFDPVANKAYVVPPLGYTKGSTFEITATSQLFNISNANYIQFYGITFDGATGELVKATGSTATNSTGIEFYRCKFKNSGLALVNTYQVNAQVYDTCDFSAWGGGGALAGLIIDASGVGSTLTGGACNVTNCDFHDGGWLIPSQAIFLAGVGHVVQNTQFSNLPHSAISFGGCNNVITKNNTYSLCVTESCDMGAVYSSSTNVLHRGNVVTDSTFTDIGNNLPGQCAVYLDNATAGTIITWNQLSRVAQYLNHNYGAFYLNGCADTIITDNVIDECPISLNFSSYAHQNYGSAWIPNLTSGSWYTQLSAAIAGGDARVAAYPELASLATYFAGGRWNANAASPSYYYPLSTTFARNRIVNRATPARGEYSAPTVKWGTYNTYDSCVNSSTLVGSLQIGTNSRE